ncbi:MAG TPA: dihydrodipicolinate synthase family protein [Planctomycetota bacterium]|nr:dihydrodipicolinate synthase family protein [Planctomycetota bacterium]
MHVNWKGVFPAVTTQFKKDQSLDLDGTARHIDALIGSGVTGLVMLGSLGENAALEPEEKRRVMQAAIKAAAGRVPVLSGIAECSTAAACRYARDMELLGANGLMVLPAMVYKSDARETIAHFRAVANASDLPIICYNNPLAYGVDITPEMFAELADQKTLVAIKESSGNVRRITDIINLVGKRYILFTGVDDLALESILLGADGWIAGVGLAFPRENQHLWDLAAAGEWEKARELYRWYMPLLHLDIPLKFVQYIKLAIQECGLGSEWVRAPRLPLIGPEREEILRIIRRGIETRPNIPARFSR